MTPSLASNAADVAFFVDALAAARTPAAELVLTDDDPPDVEPAA